VGKYGKDFLDQEKREKRRRKHHSHYKVLKKGQSTWKKRDNIVSTTLDGTNLTHSFPVLLGPGPSASCLALLLWRKAS